MSFFCSPSSTLQCYQQNTNRQLLGGEITPYQEMGNSKGRRLADVSISDVFCAASYNRPIVGQSSPNLYRNPAAQPDLRGVETVLQILLSGQLCEEQECQDVTRGHSAHDWLHDCI